MFGLADRLVPLSGQPIACLATARCCAARSPLGDAQHAPAARQSRPQRAGTSGQVNTWTSAGYGIWMVVCLAFAVAFNIVRIYEFAHLNVSWDRDAYGSIVWLTLGLHTTHIVTDFLDSIVLDGADVHRPGRRAPVRGRRRERRLLVFRRARLAANLRGDLLGTASRVDAGDVRWLTPLPLWSGILAGPVAWALDLGASYALVKWVCHTSHYGAAVRHHRRRARRSSAAARWCPGPRFKRTRWRCARPTADGRANGRGSWRFWGWRCALFALQILAGAIPYGCSMPVSSLGLPIVVYTIGLWRSGGLRGTGRASVRARRWRLVSGGSALSSHCRRRSTSGATNGSPPIWCSTSCSWSSQRP